MKKIGIFGGSFDPIHFGHLSLALQLSEIHHLDEVLFIPVFCSPFKKEAPPAASPEQRMEMLRLALAPIPSFRISTLEIARNGTSYTIDTLRLLHSPESQLHLLLSDEAASHFLQWKEPEEILRLAPPWIGGRSSSKANLPPSLQKYFTPTQIFEVSSTEIRARLRKKLYCGHLIPAKALDYIQAHHLYS